MLIDSNKKVIFFDIDDTLLNSKMAEHNAITNFKKIFNEFNQIEESTFVELWHSMITELYDKYFKKEISFEDQQIKRIKRLFTKLEFNVGTDEAKEKFKIYLDLYEKNWLVFEDSIEVLENLKDKYVLAVISNGDSIQQRRKLEKTEIVKYFSEIIISSEVGFAKPNKNIFAIACEKLNVKPEECVMVGDKFSVDIKGALNAGMSAVWVNQKSEDISYEYTIKNLKELI